MKRILCLLVLFFTIISCELKNDCGECFTPPRQFSFEFVDKDSGDDLFEIGEFNKNDLKIYDESNANIDFEFMNFENRNVLVLNSIGWELEPKIYSIELNDDITVVFELDMNAVSEDCCSFFEVKKFEIQSFEYIETTSHGIIQIKI